MSPPLNPKLKEAESEIVRLRLTARFCIALACLVQFIARMATISNSLNLTGASGSLVIASLPLAPLMTITVAIEYLLFKKFGSKIAKFSFLVDVILLLLFVGDWVTGTISFFLRSQKGPIPVFPVSALFGFMGFTWRSLLVTLMVQRWQFKIIAPVVAIMVTTGYAIHFDPKNTYSYVIRSISQLFNVIFIIYCEDKIKWRMIWTNIRQEKWMQMSNFILNNIPENIMIFDFSGEVKFISDYCKAFMNKCHHFSLDTKDFLHKIRDLQQQKYDSDLPSLTMMDLQTENEFLTEVDIKSSFTLADLISGFRTVIKKNSLQERQFIVYNGKLKTQNQTDKSIEVKISFVQHLNCENLIIILRDTTQRDLLITLEKTNKYKDQLIASVSHELRAPLNGNINLVEAAVNSLKIPENIKETLLIPALRSSKFLLHIINDILDMSQIKEKKLRLIFQSGDFKETLQSTAQLVELQAKKKGIDFVLNFDPKLPKKFCTDHIRLSQIVLNFLSNAIKFTKEGSVKLIAEPMNQGRFVKILVEDTGIGMSQENVKKLFSNYTHIEFEGRQTINPTGVGLGLNIASHLVQLLNPKGHQNISVISVLNQGSTFSFVLENKENPPILNGDPEDEDGSLDKIADESPGDRKPILFSKIETSGSPNSKSQKSDSHLLLETCLCPKILIVDDNPFNTMAFETILNSLEIKCDSVYSGASAIKKLLYRENEKCGKDCKQYSVIFMDQEMPEMNGIETVKEIRRLQKDKEIFPQDMRIFGCTAHKSKEDVDRFVGAGLDKCIHKPISVAMIKDLL